jgi:dimethylamine monooxygenase subunit B
MANTPLIPVKVVAIEQATPLVKHFTLSSLDGSLLPAFAGGSHIVVSMQDNGKVHRNPYSLMGSSKDLRHYHIGVRRQEQSRGGSVFMHDRVKVGDQLAISHPVNLFALASHARKHILIAGGIGITPFMSQMQDLRQISAHYELHYAVRSAEHAAFAEQLKQEHPGKIHLYLDSLGNKLNISGLLSDQPLGSHVYVCGPAGMVDAVRHTAQELGWAHSHVHYEEFTAPATGKPYTAVLARSGIEIEVDGSTSLLDAVEEAGIDAPYMCRGGVCGACETCVIEGEVEHHDHYLSAEDKAANKKMMICVSRAKSPRIIVNL